MNNLERMKKLIQWMEGWRIEIHPDCYRLKNDALFIASRGYAFELSEKGETDLIEFMEKIVADSDITI